MRHSRLQPQTMHSRFQASMRYIWRYKYLYLLLLPAVLYFLIFHYLPMYGVIISFKDFNFKKGILGSEWIGLENFEYMFGLNDFYRVFWNSFCLSFLRLVFEFPIPIILALLLNEISGKRFKKITQTAIYLPHFLSWAVIGGILVNFLSPTWGVVNQIIQQLGFDPIFFLGDPKYFRTTAVISSIWKEAGWGTIIYLAAITGIDVEQYEAATVDCAWAASCPTALNRSIRCRTRKTLPCPRYLKHTPTVLACWAAGSPSPPPSGCSRLLSA